jgi:hypothetical protein
MLRRATFALVLLFATPASATVLWRGDFETGDKSQWEGAQAASPDRLQIVTSPVRQGKYALRVEVRNGDFVSSGNRAELVRTVRDKEGDDRYYAWSTMWPMDYPSEATWQLFTQWHHDGSSGSPPFEMYVNGETMTLRVMASTVLWTAPLSRGKWHDFIVHVKWSSDAKVGFVELWYDGVNVLPKKMTATMYAGQDNYLKMGLYRNSTIKPTGVIFHDGMTMATSLDDVLGPKMDGGVMETGSDAVVEETATDSAPPAEDTSVATDSASATDTATPESDTGAPPAATATNDDGGCSCSTPHRTPASYGWLAALVILALRRRAS